MFGIYTASLARISGFVVGVIEFFFIGKKIALERFSIPKRQSALPPAKQRVVARRRFSVTRPTDPLRELREVGERILAVQTVPPALTGQESEREQHHDHAPWTNMLQADSHRFFGQRVGRVSHHQIERLASVIIAPRPHIDVGPDVIVRWLGKRAQLHSMDKGRQPILTRHLPPDPFSGTEIENSRRERALPEEWLMLDQKIERDRDVTRWG